MKNSKLWIYPLTIYIAAAVLLFIGCADQNKNKRVPIKSSTNNLRDKSGPSSNNNLSAANAATVKSNFENATTPAIKAAAATKSEDINSKMGKDLVGELTTTDQIDEGNYEIKGVTLSGNVTDGTQGARIYLTSEIKDLNNMDGAVNTLYTSAPEKKADGKTTTAGTKSTADRSASAADRAAQRDQNRERNKQAQEDRKKLTAQDKSELDAVRSRAFSYVYAFGRRLTISKNDFVENDQVQINAFLSSDRREMKVSYNKRGTGNVDSEMKDKTPKEMMGNARAASGKTYACSNGNKCEISFRQDKGNGDLQILITETHESSSGNVQVIKSITMIYSKKAVEKKDNKETPPGDTIGSINGLPIVPKNETFSA